MIPRKRSRPNNRQKNKPRGGNRAKEQQRVTEPLTPQTLRKETRTSTNLKFRPLEKKIGGDLRASERRVKEQGDWWQNYLNTVSGAQADTTAAYQQAAATGQAQVAQASSVDTANTARLQAEANQSAALRGAAPSTAPAEREAAMQAQRNYLAAAQGGATAQMGATQHAYLNEQKRIGVGQSIASRKEEQRRGRSIRQDRRDLARERGDYATTKRGELRDKEREYQIQRGAFGLDKRKAGLEAQEASREAREERRKAGLESEENRRQNEAQRNENRKNRREGKEKKGGGGLTPSERHDAREGRQNAWKEANALYHSEAPPVTDKEWAAFQSHLASLSEISPAEASWAVERLRGQETKRSHKKAKHHLEKNYPHR